MSYHVGKIKGTSLFSFIDSKYKSPSITRPATPWKVKEIGKTKFLCQSALDHLTFADTVKVSSAERWIGYRIVKVLVFEHG